MQPSDDEPRSASAMPTAWACEVANKFYVETYDSLSSAQTVHALAALLADVRTYGENRGENRLDRAGLNKGEAACPTCGAKPCR